MTFNHMCPLNRRELLGRSALGIAGLGLGALLSDSGFLSSGAQAATGSAGRGQTLHFPAKAKRVIHIYAGGGPSHLDTFDLKPALKKYQGKTYRQLQQEGETPLSTKETVDQPTLKGALQESGFEFRKHGESGIEISELFPCLARQADRLCVVRSMTTTSSSHEQALMMMSTGDAQNVRPSMGSWALYGLGIESQNLPAFVALTPSGVNRTGDRHYRSAFLPGWTEGTMVPTRNATVASMIQNIQSSTTSLQEQRRQLDLLTALNQQRALQMGQEAELDERIRAYEVAFRMQVEAAEAFDLSRETSETRALYGDSPPQGRQLLLARRLLERGVRYVQAWHVDWDTHDENDARHRVLCQEIDQPLAALLEDLARCGLLDETLVLWAGEFGRTPTGEVGPGRKGVGRDHNNQGFSIWMAGGGVKPGMVYGATDETGAIAVEGVMDNHDLHATILRLLGFDHTKLTYRYAGRDFRLTDVKGRVVEDLIA